MSHILVVDDDPVLRRSISTLLSRAGHVVAQADSGLTALDVCREHDVDLVVTDINMPEMDGIEFILELREHRSEVPVIAMSGGGLLPKELLLGNAGYLGAVRTLPKPFETSELLDAVESVLRPDGSTT